MPCKVAHGVVSSCGLGRSGTGTCIQADGRRLAAESTYRGSQRGQTHVAGDRRQYRHGLLEVAGRGWRRRRVGAGHVCSAGFAGHYNG